MVTTIRFCSKSRIFDKIKKINIKMIDDNVVENIFNKNAYFYNNKNTLKI